MTESAKTIFLFITIKRSAEKRNQTSLDVARYSGGTTLLSQLAGSSTIEAA
ncbi:MAG TPA: hypothetical protein PKL48_05905 [Thermodesulfobacteriota bacterium]|nr:hypothetical protein [Deltaproteobacteria bacterium]HNU71231.1 hypothetical protein [Thermodesulfobacteriota bacterium]